jgi:hypothetical protein
VALASLASASHQLSEGGAEEGEHAVAGDVREGGDFEGVVAAVEFQGAGVGAMAAQGGEHLGGQFGEEGGVVLAVDHEGVLAGAQAALDVGHGADGGPEVAEFVDGDVVAQAFPDVVGGHTLADHVCEVGGDVEEAAGTEAFVVDQGDIADGGADAGTEDAQARETPLFEPAEATAGILDGLAVGLEREADVGADELVGAFVALGHAAVVVGEAHPQHSDPDALEPLAQAALAVPFGVPVGKEEDRGTLLRCREELRVDGVVLGPGGGDRAGESEDIVGSEAVVAGGGGGEPMVARFDGLLGILARELGRVGVAGVAADVLETPVEGLDATIVVGGPAAMLVAADAAFEPMHRDSRQLTVYR